MTSEKQGFDIGEFVDEGLKNAGLSDEEAVQDSPGQEEDTSAMTQIEAAQTEQAETKEKKETEKKAADSSSEDDIQAALKSTEEAELESVIGSMLPKAEEYESAQEQQRKSDYVPLESHTKLRERAQRAEQERDELRRRLEATSTVGEKTGKAEKSPLEKFVEENPDEDFIPARVQVEQKRWEDAQRLAEIQARQREEQTQREAQEAIQQRAKSIKAIENKALNSETEFRKSHNDYDAVTAPLVKAGLLTNAEKISFLKAENPAQKLYEICKAKREALGGIFGKPSSSETTAKESKPANKAPAKPEEKAKGETVAEEDMTDEEIFDAAFPDKQHPNIQE